ncbi:hypothetical protein LCGC14_0223310 [marine sediment metagenome]|uniref:Uncharacterized protein n=1 Tax=marine sediment metagenome TaxID=412755 RepID=A0A0F9XFV4_9ZZZZ|nr:hypothetical protein [bacterium]
MKGVDKIECEYNSDTNAWDCAMRNDKGLAQYRMGVSDFDLKKADIKIKHLNKIVVDFPKHSECKIIHMLNIGTKIIECKPHITMGEWLEE